MVFFRGIGAIFFVTLVLVNFALAGLAVAFFAFPGAVRELAGLLVV